MGSPDSSVGKESACNAGDPTLILGSGRSAGEGNGYLFQDSGASVVTQLVKNPPAKKKKKEFACNAGDPGLITGSGICLRRHRLPTPAFLGFPGGSAGEESACNAGDLSF